jgi:hypothetical protein
VREERRLVDEPSRSRERSPARHDVPGFFVARIPHHEPNEATEMTYETEAYRRPHRRGDFHLVDTTREGTYWHSPDGIVVRMASGERERFGAGEHADGVEMMKGR